MQITPLVQQPYYKKQIAQMIYQQFVIGSSSTKSLLDVERFLEHTHTESLPITFVASAQQQCFGTVSLFENDCPQRPQYTPWLASLFVDEAFRGKKIAQHLIEAVLQKARDLGYKQVYLKTEEASAYYKTRGWTYIETIQAVEPFDIFKYEL